jgi:hypothetical protein
MTDSHLGNDERHDRLGAELFHGAEPVVPVRRPVLSVARRHGDDGVEEPIELVDRAGESFDVRFREIALEGRGLDTVDGQGGEDLPRVRRGGRGSSRGQCRRRPRSCARGS